MDFYIVLMESLINMSLRRLNYCYSNDMDRCLLCNHEWICHDDLLHKKYGFQIRHLAGGDEENPIWCYCKQMPPQNNLEYLEYMNLVNENCN